MNRLIVVGAGPAGLTLALQLARAGQPVTLVEARRDFSRSFRGDALMPCGLEALARMGLWSLLEELPQRALTGWSIWLEGRRLFRSAEPMGALHPCRLVPQRALLEALLDQALSLAAFDWQPGSTVSGLLRSGPEQRIRGVILSDGRRLSGDLVVGCDGRDSSLRHLAGLAMKQRGEPLELLWFQQPLPPDASAELSDFYTLVGGGAIASACSNADGMLQLGWLLRAGRQEPRRSPDAWAETLASPAPEPLATMLRRHDAPLSRPERFRIQVGLAQHWYRPGLLLLGDAAHPMSPIRAQGINMALRDSLVAATELLATARTAPAAAGPATAAMALDLACQRIEQRRRPEIARVQTLQLSEARQGHWIGHKAWLRHGLARTAPVMGPVARAVWQARQRPLREGATWL